MLDKVISKKIAIDIDDVLSSTIPNLLKFLKECHGIDYKYEEFLNYKFHEVEYFISRNITKDIAHDLWDDFSNSIYGKNMETIPGSEMILKAIKERGFEIYLITARWESLRENTLEWLELRYPKIEFSGLYFTGNFHGKGVKKSEVCRELGIELMIEDNADNVLDLADNGIRSYLITRPWNESVEINHPNIRRITTWQEIL